MLSYENRILTSQSPENFQYKEHYNDRALHLNGLKLLVLAKGLYFKTTAEYNKAFTI